MGCIWDAQQAAFVPVASPAPSYWYRYQYEGAGPNHVWSFVGEESGLTFRPILQPNGWYRIFGLASAVPFPDRITRRA
jgi:hypothetical protein